jgi:hypothetical protein
VTRYPEFRITNEFLTAGHWFLAAAEGCLTFGGFWLTSTFRNHLDLSSVF